jgi:hypothetical protein
MNQKKMDDVSAKRKRRATWLSGTLTMPLVALPMIKNATPGIEFDIPTVMILCFFWGISSFVLRIFINKNM